ncbi:MAG: proton-conducting transporter membrane subunit [Bacillota bacterium]|nr:proton-conducting transporter membrane subunit [Bacillota bacterium]
MNGYQTNIPIIALIIPFAAALAISLFGEKLLNLKKAVTVLSVLASLFCLGLLAKYIILKGEIATYWMSKWIPEGKLWAVGIGLQIDGLGLFAAFIVAVVCFVAFIYSAEYMKQHVNMGKYYAAFLLLYAGMLGFMFSGDLFNMYIMIEIVTIASAALIAFNNSMHRSIEAGLKYLLINAVSSSFILLGIVLLYIQTHTVNIAQLAVLLYQEPFNQLTILALALMLTGFAVKVFLFPCHSWLADTITSAPAPVSTAVSAAAGTMGIYALIRMLYFIFPGIGRTELEYLMVFWGCITMISGALMAFRQEDFKRTIGFLLASQMGYIIAGLGVGLASDGYVSVMGTVGSLYYTLSFVFFSSLLILCTGAIKYGTGTAYTEEIGGLYKVMPFTAAMFFIGAASLTGIPVFNGFPARWMFYVAAWKAGFIPVAVIAAAVSIMNLISMVLLGKTIFFGKQSRSVENIKPIPLMMKFAMAVLSIGCIAGGTVPDLINRYLVKPAAASIYDIGSYIDVMFVKGYSLKVFKQRPEIPNMDHILTGWWQPGAWLILFITLMISLIILLSLHLRTLKASVLKEENGTSVNNEAVIKGMSESTKPLRRYITGALKYRFEIYYDGMRRIHSSSVNDYLLWVVTSLAVVTIWLFAVL